MSVPVQASNLKKGDYVVIKNRPCKILKTTTCKTGKHGHGKTHLYTVDIFTGKKYEELSPSTANLLSPVVKRSEYTLVDLNEEGYCSLLGEDGTVREDLSVDLESELGQEIQCNFNDDQSIIINTLFSMDEEQIQGFKIDK